jgi:hypothetical protein
MAAMRRQHCDEEDSSALKATGKIVEMSRRGGWLSTAFSALAVGLSCFSVYVSTLQGPKLEVYVPPTIHYGRDADSQVFAIPVTIANSGARSAAVFSLELQVQNVNTNATGSQ